jgi:hypothetical protein
MSKHLRTLWTAAAALAAAAVLVSTSAVAQAPGPLKAPQAQAQLAGGPGSHEADVWGRYERRGDDRGYDDRRGDDRRYDDWRRRERVDFQVAQATCSRAAIQEVWSRGQYSAQYEGGPKLVEGLYGYELRGRIRIHDRKGIWTRDSICELRRGEASEFIILR